MVTVGEVGVGLKAEVVAAAKAFVAGDHSVVGQALGVVESVLQGSRVRETRSELSGNTMLTIG